MAAWGDTSEEEEDSQDGEKAVALVARKESDSDCDSIESLSQLKEEVHNLIKSKLEKLVFTLMEECEIVNSENCMLKTTCSGLEKDVKRLERKKQELGHMNEVLTCEKLKSDEKVLVLCNELDTLKEVMNKREEVFNTDLSKL